MMIASQSPNFHTTTNTMTFELWHALAPRLHITCLMDEFYFNHQFLALPKMSSPLQHVNKNHFKGPILTWEKQNFNANLNFDLLTYLQVIEQSWVYTLLCEQQICSHAKQTSSLWIGSQRGRKIGYADFPYSASPLEVLLQSSYHLAAWTISKGLWSILTV